MEDLNHIVKVITCQKCYQHKRIDSHQEYQYIEIFNAFRAQLQKYNIKITKNIPFRYLEKLPDTRNSSKRYYNRCINKIVQFPQRGSFQVYFLNIFVYSKLETGVFPNLVNLSKVINFLKLMHNQDPLLIKFQYFKDNQADWNFQHRPRQSLYSHLNFYLPTQSINLSMEIERAMKFIVLSQNSIIKNKIIPYTQYPIQQKYHKIKNIYCSRNIKNVKKGKITKKFKIIENQLQSVQKTSKTISKKSNQKLKSKDSNKSLFNMVRLCSNKTNQIKNINLNINTIRGKKINNFSKDNKLYFITLRKNTNTIKNHQETKYQIKLIKNQSKDQNYFGTLQSSDYNCNNSSVYRGFLYRKRSSRDNSITSQSSINDNLLSPQTSYKQINEQFIIPDNQGYDQIITNNSMKFVKQKTFPQFSLNHNIQINIQQNQIIDIKNNNQDQKLVINTIQIQNQQTKVNQNNNQKKYFYQQADIISKFSEKLNFMVYDQLDQNIINKQITNFPIKLSQKTMIFKSFSQIYPQQKLLLFPKIFKMLQQDKNNLTAVVNILINNNPNIIMRLFQRLNYSGKYCVWLYSRQLMLIPIVIDDLVYVNLNNSQVYGLRDCQGAIWLILLQKAIAKVFGDYQYLKSISVAQAFQTILACPTIQLTSFNLQTFKNIFQQNIFLTRHAYIYSKSQKSQQIQRIIGFKYNNLLPQISNLQLQTITNKFLEIEFKDFQKDFKSLTLIFFNYHYFYNQIKLSSEKQKNKLIIVEINSKYGQNHCWISLNCNQETETKIEIYQRQQLKQYPYIYIGEITKKCSYFIQINFNVGKYLCLITSSSIKNLFTYSIHPTYLSQIKIDSNFDEIKTILKKNNSQYKILKNYYALKSQNNNYPLEIKTINTLKTANETILNNKRKNQSQKMKRTILDWKNFKEDTKRQAIVNNQNQNIKKIINIEQF